MFVKFNCHLKLNVNEMHFCGNNVVVVRCIWLKMHFVVIIMVIIPYVLKKEQDGCRRLCENTKGFTNSEKLRDTASEGTALR